MGCHIPGGWADQSGSSFLLADPTRQGYLATNLAATLAAAKVIISGQTLLVGKATGVLPHPGGAVIAAGGPEAVALANFVAATNFESGCDLEVSLSTVSKLELLGDGDLLRKAALHVAGRLPTNAEAQRVQRGDLDGALDSLASGTGFGDFVERAIDDKLGSWRFAVNFYASDVRGDSFQGGNRDTMYWFVRDPSGSANLPKNVDNAYLSQRHISLPGLYLARYLAENGKDWRAILTSSQTVLSPWSARNFSKDFSYELLTQTPWVNAEDPDEHRLVTVPAENYGPWAGLLTDIGFLQTYESTSTNRGRRRARAIYQMYLGFDPMTLGSRSDNLPAILSAADPNSKPPYMSNPACLVCHAILDPMAKTMFGYEGGARYSPPDGTMGDYPMADAGFEKVAMPSDQADAALPWLAHQLAMDPRFATGTASFWYTQLVGRQPLSDPSSTEDPDTFFAAQKYEADLIASAAQSFVSSGYKLGTLVRELVKTPTYRARDILPDTPAADRALLQPFVTMRWTGPTRLNNRLLATLGQTFTSADGQWNTHGWLNQPLVRNYLALLGDIDWTINSTQTNSNPSGMMVRTTTAIASQLACQLIASDFALPAASRQLFRNVEVDMVPTDGVAAAAIQANLASVYGQVLGMTGAAAQAEVQAAWAVFMATYSNTVNDKDQSIPGACGPHGSTVDPTMTLNSYLAALAFILADPRLTME